MFKAEIKNKYDSEIVCDVDLIDDISNNINQIEYAIRYDSDDEYDPEFDKLPEDLWLEEKQKQRLHVLQARSECLMEMYWALEKLIKLTDIEMSELDNA